MLVFRGKKDENVICFVVAAANSGYYYITVLYFYINEIMNILFIIYWNFC